MERPRRLFQHVKDSCQATIQWRTPASAPLLMAINTTFWVCVFYIERISQLRILFTIAAVIFSWEILFDPSYGHSIVVHILFWPIRSFFLFSAFSLSLLSAYALQGMHAEHACWLAYGTVGSIVISPVWHYHRGNECVVMFLYKMRTSLSKFVYRFIFSPAKIGYEIVEYIVLLKWLSAIVYAVETFCKKLTDFIVNLSLTCVTYIRTFCNSFKLRIKTAVIGVKNSIQFYINEVKNCIIQIIKACKLWIWSLCLAIREWIYEKVILTIRNALIALYQFLRYYLCAYWWPDLKLRLKQCIAMRLHRLFNYICFVMVYVFCGYWIAPALSFLHIYLARLCGFIYRRSIVPVSGYLMKFLTLALHQFRGLCHQLAVLIRDSVIWPFCSSLLDFIKWVGAKLYLVAIDPFAQYLSAKYRKVEDSIYIYILAPICTVIVNIVPEKSPFCDDTDTELADFLPEDENENARRNSDVSNSSHDSSLRKESISSISFSDGDENDFLRGLKFTAVEASDSSGDEDFKIRERSNCRPKWRSERIKGDCPEEA